MIRKGVIVAAGYGTRFLPATKTVPKEMFPIIDVPCVERIVEEFADSGVEELLVITSRRKKALEDYFDHEIELETTFRNEGAESKLEKVLPRAGLKTYFIRQPTMRGTGDAILLAAPFAGDDPCVIAYPDDIVINGPPLAGQLAQAMDEAGGPEKVAAVLWVEDHSGEDVSRYGVVAPSDGPDGRAWFPISGMVEKPAPGTEPSHWVSFGRYVVGPKYFPVLRRLSQEHDYSRGEFFQTDAINELASTPGAVIAASAEGERIDVGVPAGYVKAILRSAMERDDLRDDICAYARQLLNQQDQS